MIVDSIPVIISIFYLALDLRAYARAARWAVAQSSWYSVLILPGPFFDEGRFMDTNVEVKPSEFIIPPSSAPIPQPEQRENYITDLGQVCYERVLPSEAHFYKPYKAPQCTG